MLGALSKSTLFTLFASICGYALTIYLARFGGAESYGAYAYTLGWSLTISTVVDFGSIQSYSHFAMTLGSRKLALEVVMCIRAIVFGIVIGTATVISVFWGNYQFLLSSVLALPVFSLAVIFEFQKQNVWYAKITFFEKMALLSTNVLLLELYGQFEFVYWSYAAIALLSLAYQFQQNSFHLRQLLIFRSDLVRKYLYDYWAVAFMAVAQLAFGVLSRLVIEHKKGLAAFAYVSLAFQLIAISSVFQVQVDRVFRVPFFEAFEQKSLSKIIAVTFKYILFTTLPLSMLAFFIFYWSELIVSVVFGSGFELVSDSLQALSPLLLSVNLMKFAGIFWTALHSNERGLKLNLVFSSLMMATLMTLGSDQPISSFLWVIVVFQYTNVALSFIQILYLTRRYVHG